MPFADKLVGRARLPLLILLGAVLLVLTIACANIANLLLARASARRREMAIRVAIGAGRGRVLRQFVVESLSSRVTGGARVCWWRAAGLAIIAATDSARRAAAGETDDRRPASWRSRSRRPMRPPVIVGFAPAIALWRTKCTIR